jgi:hypothetical protein
MLILKITSDPQSIQLLAQEKSMSPDYFWRMEQISTTCVPEARRQLSASSFQLQKLHMCQPMNFWKPSDLPHSTNSMFKMLMDGLVFIELQCLAAPTI